MRDELITLFRVQSLLLRLCLLSFLSRLICRSGQCLSKDRLVRLDAYPAYPTNFAPIAILPQGTHFGESRAITPTGSDSSLEKRDLILLATTPAGIPGRNGHHAGR